MHDSTPSPARRTTLDRGLPAFCLAALLVAAATAAGCDSDNKSKKTPIRGTATFEKASFQKGEKLE